MLDQAKGSFNPMKPFTQKIQEIPETLVLCKLSIEDYGQGLGFRVRTRPNEVCPEWSQSVGVQQEQQSLFVTNIGLLCTICYNAGKEMAEKETEWEKKMEYTKKRHLSNMQHYKIQKVSAPFWCGPMICSITRYQK